MKSSAVRRVNAQNRSTEMASAARSIMATGVIPSLIACWSRAEAFQRGGSVAGHYHLAATASANGWLCDAGQESR
jgi:hypothetical protein